MTRDETFTILRSRSALTSQPYGDDAIDVWHDALEEWTYREVRAALLRAARDEKKITVAHLVERLRPKADRYPAPPPSPPWPGPTEGGRRIARQISEHLRHRRQETPTDGCPLCRPSAPAEQNELF